jgi:hypothetical protein
MEKTYGIGYISAVTRQEYTALFASCDNRDLESVTFVRIFSFASENGNRDTS